MLFTSHHFVIFRMNKRIFYRRLNLAFFLDSPSFFQPLEEIKIWVRPRNLINITEKPFLQLWINIKKSATDVILQRKSGNRRYFSTKHRLPLLFFPETTVTAAKFLRNAGNRHYFSTKNRRFSVFLPPIRSYCKKNSAKISTRVGLSSLLSMFSKCKKNNYKISHKNKH